MAETTEGGMRRAVIYDARKHVADVIQRYHPTREAAMNAALALCLGEDGDAAEVRDYLTRAYEDEMPDESHPELRSAVAFAMWLRTVNRLREAVMMDPLMVAGMIVSPDYGLQTHRWSEWITPQALRLFLDPGRGQECLMYAFPGTGKTHLKCLVLEAAVSFGYRVIHNIGTLESSEHNDRIHFVQKYSDVLRVAMKHEGDEFIFLWDEPSNSIDAGDAAKSESKQFNKARSIQRKFRMATMYGFQAESQSSKRLKEANSGSLIRKRNQQSFSLEYMAKGGEHAKTVNVVDLPALAFTTYDDKAPTSLIMDVDMEALVQAVTTERSFEGQVKAMKLALQQPTTYLEKYWHLHGFDKEQAAEAKKEKKEAAKRRLVLLKELAAAVADAPDEFLNQRGTVDRDAVYAAFGPKAGGEEPITFSEARDIAQAANKLL